MQGKWYDPMTVEGGTGSPTSLRLSSGFVTHKYPVPTYALAMLAEPGKAGWTWAPTLAHMTS